MTSKSTLTTPPFHPDYGLGDAFRRAVLTYAQRANVTDAAAAYRVGKSTVYKWRQRMPQFNPTHTNGA